MDKKAILVTADGAVYHGYSFGAEIEGSGETVFNTSMVGYQEMLTDPSYSGQIVTATYPLIGNYGVNEDDFESKKIQVSGFVVREKCDIPSHYLNSDTIHNYLIKNNIPGIYGVDTRALTRKLRSAGVMTGIITTEKNPAQALAELKKLPDYGCIDFAERVTTDKSYEWQAEKPPKQTRDLNIVVVDCGLKYSILRIMTNMGCKVTAVPSRTSAKEILALNPDGILFSPGPGNPEMLPYVVETIKQIIGKKPIMGICMGQLLIGRAFGASTFKLKFGHRGSNHPVKELASGRVHITAQNHGYAIDPDTLPEEMEVSFINLDDGTVEGIRHKSLPIFSIQYHSEASPGPYDNTYLFEQFIKIAEEYKDIDNQQA